MNRKVGQAFLPVAFVRRKNTRTEAAVYTEFTENTGMNAKLALRFVLGFLASAITLANAAWAQNTKPSPPMQMQQPMHHHGDIPLVKAEYPQMGRAQASAGAQ